MRWTSALVYCAMLLGCGARTDTEDPFGDSGVRGSEGGFLDGLGGAAGASRASVAGSVPATTIGRGGAPSGGGIFGNPGGRTVKPVAFGGLSSGGTWRGSGGTWRGSGGSTLRTRGGAPATGGKSYSSGGQRASGGSMPYGGHTGTGGRITPTSGGSVASFGGTVALGGTSTISSGGQIPWTTAAGGFGNVLVQACSTVPTNECQRCQCANCRSQLIACAADSGCTQLIECALLNRCTALDCFTSGPCMSTLAALGGLLSPSVQPALSLGLCLSSNDCGC
ncbi:MAG TPA: hypothetical protein VKP30_21530 [Polyangiaceae bacterium]|nr:hypothetical protein [Polyangiaceae bacterium]